MERVYSRFEKCRILTDVFPCRHLDNKDPETIQHREDEIDQQAKVQNNSVGSVPATGGVRPVLVVHISLGLQGNSPIKIADQRRDSRI